MAKQDQLIAMTSIDITLAPGKAANRMTGEPAIRPKVQTVRAGTIFVAKDSDQQDELINAGAARKATKADIPALDGVVDLAAAEQSAIVSSAAASDNARRAEADRIKTEADRIGEAELRRMFEAEVGEPAPQNMRAPTMLKRIEEVRYEKAHGATQADGRPAGASGSAQTARSGRNDTGTPAAEQVGNTAAPTSPTDTTEGADTGANKAGRGGRAAAATSGDDENLV